jgi:hypothetical protein
MLCFKFADCSYELTMTPVQILLNSLYWLGVLLVLTGVALRFTLGKPQWALALALIGAALLLAARVNSALRPRTSMRRTNAPRGGPGPLGL